MANSPETREETFTGVGDLVETIRRLSGEHQDRMVRIVLLLADAPAGVQHAVHRMLVGMLEAPPESVPEWIAEVDALIEYLEANGFEAVSRWDGSRNRTSAVRALLERLN